MKNCKLAFKLFYKDLFLLISFVAFFVFVNYKEISATISLYNFGNLEMLSYLGVSLELAIFCMVYFMFISYEYFYKLKRANLNECIKATKNGDKILFGSQFLVMIVLNFIITITFIIYNIGTYIAFDIQHTEYLIHILLNIFSNIFIVSLIGTLIGISVALVFKRLKAYLLLMLFAILTSTIFESIVSLIFTATGKNVYPAFEFFNLYSPSLNWEPNSNFGLSILPYRIEIMLFWIFAIFAIIVFKLSRNKEVIPKIIAIICTILCVTNLVLYFQPSSKLIMSNSPIEALNSDLNYYFKTTKINEQAEFEIIKYDLDIKVTNLLSVKAKLTINTENLPGYKLTLYHGYKVKKATDQNNTPLNFKQNGDYIYIENNNLDLKEITLVYSGYSPKFYSNTGGVCLPGYFPYYPHSGYKRLFNTDPNNQGFEKILLPNIAEFNINIESNKKIYTNLEEKDNRSFLGMSNAVTLMSGFLETTTASGIEVIYPYLDKWQYNQTTIEKDINEFLEIKTDNNIIKKIFILPNLNLSYYEKTALYNDHMTVQQINTLPKEYKNQLINYDKYALYQLVSSYKDNSSFYKNRLKNEKAKNTGIEEEEKYANLFEDKLNKVGKEQILEKSDIYINDDNDKRTIWEFLNDID